MAAALELKALPPKETIAYFKAKGYSLAPSFAWQDVVHEGHATAFTVAKSAGFDILKDVHAAALKAMAEGQTFDQFRKELTPTLQAKGWWGKQIMTDPADGKAKEVQLGSPNRLQIIYDANMRTSHAAGRWAQIQRVKDRRPFLRYVAVMDGRTRPAHRKWHGLVLRVDDPTWNWLFTPNGWRCRCSIQQLSQRDLDRYGYKVSAAPIIETKPWVNPRTGEVVHVPEGIDPGWGYNPGKAALDGHAAQALNTKLIDAPPELAAAASAASAEFVVPALTKDFGKWVDELATQMTGKAMRTTGERRVIGALDKTVLTKLEAEGMVPASGAITVSDANLAHMIRDAKVKAGKATSLDLVKTLPSILATPEAVLWDKQKGNLLYVASAGAKDAKFIVEINRAEKLPKGQDGKRASITTNSVITTGTVERRVLQDRNKYEIVSGSL